MAKEDNLKSWKKGQSGNPKGRPKGARNWSKVYMELLELESEIMNPITGKAQKVNQFEKTVIAQFKEAFKGNVTAQNQIIERVLGKNKETIDINADIPKIDITKLFPPPDEY
tara:strand:+ start:345 stop:680 length:336 start_codon:yes stop_codon:yes gene_type:complete